MTPRARIVMTAVAGTEPVIMLTAPAPATERVLTKAGMTLDDIDLFEVNEAFASVVLDWFRVTGVDREQGERQRRRDGPRASDRGHRVDADQDRSSTSWSAATSPPDS